MPEKPLPTELNEEETKAKKSPRPKKKKTNVKSFLLRKLQNKIRGHNVMCVPIYARRLE